MSSLLRELDQYYDEEEEEYDDYYDEEEVPPHDAQEELKQEEEEDIVEPVKQLSIELESKKKDDRKKQKQNQKGNKKENKNQNKEKGKESKIEYRDPKELEYYNSLMNGGQKKEEKIFKRDELHFQMNQKLCIQMNYDYVPIKEIHYVETNPKHAEVKTKKLQNYNFQLSDQQLEASIVDEKQEPIPKYKITSQKVSQEQTSLEHVLKRSFYAMASIGSKVYIQGGMNRSTIFSDLLCIDTEESSITVYQNSLCGIDNIYPERVFGHLYCAQALPAAYGHKMISFTHQVYGNIAQGLLLFGGIANYPLDRRMYSYNLGSLRSASQAPYADEMKLYFIGSPQSIETIHYGFRFKQVHSNYNIKINVYCHPFKSAATAANNYLTKRKDFCLAHLSNNSIWIFGGRANDGSAALNDLYCIEFVANTDTYTLQKFTPSKSKLDQVWPKGRFGAMSAAVGTKFFVLGGQTSNSYLNDLYVFDTVSKLWTEVILEGNQIPAPISFSALFRKTDISFFILGGRNKDQVFDSLYRYDFNVNKFYLVNVLGHGNHKNASAKLMQVPVYGVEACVVPSGTVFKMVTIGGVNERGVHLNRLIQIDEINEEGEDSLLCKYLYEKKQQNTFTDLMFRVQEQKGAGKIINIMAHKCIISCRCDYLSTLLQQNTSHQVIDIGDCNAAVLDAYLQYLYTGNFDLVKEENIKEFIELVGKWSPKKHYPIISRIAQGIEVCNMENTTKEIQKQMEQDFAKLINEQAFSDITLRLPQTGYELYAHKVVLCRSSFFKSMFTSGMLESVADSIDLEHETEDSVMMEILKFLYTDSIEISPNNVVSVLLMAIHFNVREVVTYCRNQIKEFLTTDNVAQVLQVALYYVDLVLKRICIAFIIDNFEDVKVDDKYQSLVDQQLRAEIERTYQLKRGQRKK